MKKIYYLLIVLIFISCEEVVQVDLTTAPPRLVVEAAINWQLGTTGNLQTIKLSTTTGFYDTEIPIVTNAVVYIENSSNVRFDFVEVPETGKYVCNDFLPVVGETYFLTIMTNGETYTANETLAPVVPITEIIQDNDGGIVGDVVELKAYFDDPADEANFYLFQYNYDNQVKSSLYTQEDTFFNGNTFFSLSDSENYSPEPGEVVVISHYGISESYFNFMSIVVSLAGQTGGGPFQSPPATIRGNVVNATNSSNFPLGYFSLSQVDRKEYTIQ